MITKYKDLKIGDVFYGQWDRLCEKDRFIKVEEDRSHGIICDCDVGWNAQNMSRNEPFLVHFHDDDDVHIFPALLTYEKGKKKWHSVIGFRTLPRDCPQTAKPDVEFAKFTGLGDAYTYVHDLVKRPVIRECYHLIVVK